MKVQSFRIQKLQKICKNIRDHATVKIKLKNLEENMIRKMQKK